MMAGASGAASAQDAAHDEARYQELIGQALDEYERGNWDEAEGLFAQAHRIRPNARTLRGIGIAAFEARRYVRAVAHLRAALGSSVNPLTREQRTEVERALERAQTYVATIEITTDPAAAEVRVNDEPLAGGGAVRLARVDPGLIQLRASAPSHSTSVRELRVAAGERQRLLVQLVPLRATPTRAAPAGTAKDRGDAPISARSAPPPDGPRFGAWKWLALGVGGLALLGGGSAHVMREVTASDYNHDASCLTVAAGADLPNRCRTRRQRMRDTELFMALGYGAGAMFVGGALLMLVLEGGAETTSERADGWRLGVGAVQCFARF
jgi:hypothetical protein